MKKHLYLSLIPESLIASMLTPEQFGNYYAVGTEKRSRGQALFFEVDPDFESDHLPLHQIEERCVPHEDGTPRRSTYLSIYRVLEHVPLSALGKLHLVTTDGRVLALEKKNYEATEEDRLHLYQEFCPVNPRVASTLNPVEFWRHMTDASQPISVEKIVYCEMRLEELATDPETGTAEDLPYHNIHHLRDCLLGLKYDPKKKTKVVMRHLQQEVLFRTVRSGFFAGDKETLLHYPMPSLEELELKHHPWWRSALTTFGN